MKNLLDERTKYNLGRFIFGIKLLSLFQFIKLFVVDKNYKINIAVWNFHNV
jgi:hypothetical protein